MGKLKKNIQPVLADIRHRKYKRAVFANWESRKEKNSDKKSESKFFLPRALQGKKLGGFIRKAAVILAVVSVFSVFLYGAYLWSFKDEARQSVLTIIENFKQTVSSMANLENDSVNNSLNTIDSEIQNLNSRTAAFNLMPVLKEVPEVLLKIKELTNSIGLLNKNLIKLKGEGLGLLFTANGENKGEFLGLLKNVNINLKNIAGIMNDLRNRVSKYKSLPSDLDSRYFSLNVNFIRVTDGLDAMIKLLEKPGATHFVMIFENPSEIRPAGGFTGSYADVVLENGSVKNIDVNDIYYPDKFLDLNVKPPKQLQTITTDWGARDANWFFDFPTSAGKIINFLEASNVYKAQDIKFAGVIAINVRVIEDILKKVGPIEVPQYDLVLDDKNFLREVQEEVEEGRDKNPGQNPKKILSIVTPLILERLHSLDDAGKAELFDDLSARIKNKDIKFYFKDEQLQNLAVTVGSAGEVFNLPADFKGDYLAVVNTNVASGKSDAFITQSIKLNSRIDGSGLVSDNLTVTRSHNGQNEKERWYRAANINFIKIFTSPDVKLRTMSGNTSKSITPSIDYVKKGYVIDEDLALVEDTEEYLSEFKTDVYKESGKTVFATWFNIPAGKTKDLNLSYGGYKKINLTNGNKYQFVLDKQSGVSSKFEYALEAPTGFKWKESNDFIFHYQSDNLPARLILNLTLEKYDS